MLDTLRYVVALILCVTFPPAILYWILIHSMADRWRRAGLMTAFGVVGLVCFALGYGLWQVRAQFVVGDWGFHPTLAVVALPIYALSVVIEIRTRSLLTTRILIGVPELLGETEPDEASGDAEAARRSSPLLTHGIYAYTRNPRYLAILVALLAFALVANYASLWALWLLCFPGFYCIVRLEEAELSGRFGEPYHAYLARVPRFVPRGLSFLRGNSREDRFTG